MTSYIQEITLDIFRASRVTINAKQGDNAVHFVRVRIEADGVPLKPDKGVSAVFRMRKDDGKSIYDNVTIEEDGRVLVPLTRQALARHGVHPADVSLMMGEEVLSTVTFFIQVDEAPLGDHLDSKDELLALVEATVAANKATAAAKEAAETANVTTEAANKAEAKRATAEKARAKAETERATKEEERDSAETARADAERLRTEAEGLRATAEAARKQAEGKRAETFAAAVESVNTAVSAAAEAAQKAEEAAGEADDAAGRANAASETAEGAAQKALAAAELPYHPPQVMDGEHYWSFWDAARGEYVQSDLPAGVWIAGVRAVTGEPGTEASVVNEGTAMEQQLVFTIPRGQDADIKTWTVSVLAEGWTPGDDTYGTITGRFCAQVPLDGLSEDPKDLRIEYAGGDMTAYCTMDYWRSAAGVLTLWATTKPADAFELKIVEVM